MPEGDVIGLRDRLVADAATLRGKLPDLKIELLCDVAPEMWNLLEERFLPKFGNDLYHLVDLHHLMEKLGAAARDRRFHGGRRKAQALEDESAEPGQCGHRHSGGVDRIGHG